VKRCPTCDQTKAAADFHKSRRTKDGLVLRCKACVSEYDRARYQANRAAAIERARLWQEANRTRKAEISRRWYANNTEAAGLPDSPRDVPPTRRSGTEPVGGARQSDSGSDRSLAKPATPATRQANPKTTAKVPKASTTSDLGVFVRNSAANPATAHPPPP